MQYKRNRCGFMIGDNACVLDPKLTNFKICRQIFYCYIIVYIIYVMSTGQYIIFVNYIFSNAFLLKMIVKQSTTVVKSYDFSIFFTDNNIFLVSYCEVQYCFGKILKINCGVSRVVFQLEGDSKNSLKQLEYKTFLFSLFLVIYNFSSLIRPIGIISRLVSDP